MKDKTLLILAAGMGSRFGGLKQMQSVGPNGEFIIDYSIYDAIKNGFNKIVFVIKKENYQVFLDTIGKRIQNKLKEKNIKIEYIFQDNKNIKNNHLIPQERIKPLGTTHAILSAKNVIKEPFIIINADDFYGHQAFEAISKYIDNSNNRDIGLVAYNILNTLTENGNVKRGLIEIKDKKLVRIIESNIINNNGQIEAYPLDGSEMIILDETRKASMNMNSFNPNFFNYLERKLDEFLKTADLINDECLITSAITDAINEKVIEVDIIETDAKWVGITYKDDLQSVKAYIQKQIDNNIYPNDLWK